MFRLGALLAPLERTITPGYAHWTASADPILAALIGGLYVFAGPILGSILYIGIKEIVVADVSTAEAAIALLVGLALMLVVYYGPVVVYQLSPARATPMLRGMSEWIMGHARPLEIVTGGGLGAIFLWKGLAVLV